MQVQRGAASIINAPPKPKVKRAPSVAAAPRSAPRSAPRAEPVPKVKQAPKPEVPIKFGRRGQVLHNYAVLDAGVQCVASLSLFIHVHVPYLAMAVDHNARPARCSEQAWCMPLHASAICMMGDWFV